MIIELPTVSDERGDLGFLQYPDHLPFKVSRVYYLYNVPSTMARGFHAHKELQQVMIALHGSLDVILDDGNRRTRIHLNKPDHGLLIDKMIWREMENFSPGSICLVLASMAYDEGDYIRSYEEFLELAKSART